MTIIESVRAFAAAHTLELVIVPIVGALLTAIFHPRSRIEYAKHPPRLAALLKLFAALTVDTPKAAGALFDLVLGVSAKVRAAGLARLVAALTIDPPKAFEAVV